MNKNLIFFLTIAILIAPTNSQGMEKKHDSDSPEIIKKLIQTGARVKDESNLFKELLNFGPTKTSNIELVKLLLSYQQPPKAEHREAILEEMLKTLLFKKDGPDLKQAAEVVQWGANINSRYKDGYTLLGLASQKQKPTIVKFLLEQGADVNITDKWDEKPIDKVLNLALHFDTTKEVAKKLIIAEYLIKHGADFYTPTRSFAPMHYVQKSFRKPDTRPATAEFIINLGKFFIEQDKRNKLDKMLTILNQEYAEYDNQSGQSDYKKIEENLKQLAFAKRDWYQDWYYAKFSKM